jgi:hypothetical protein
VPYDYACKIYPDSFLGNSTIFWEKGSNILKRFNVPLFSGEFMGIYYFSGVFKT